MNEIELKEGLRLIGVRVNDFPRGIAAGFSSIEEKLGSGRQRFGISHPRIDPKGYYVEKYLGEDDVELLVKIICN